MNHAKLGIVFSLLLSEYLCAEERSAIEKNYLLDVLISPRVAGIFTLLLVINKYTHQHSLNKSTEKEIEMNNE